MRWLVHGNITSAAAEAMRRHEHHVQTLDEIDLAAGAAPDEVLTAARKLQLDVLTADGSLAEAPYAPDATPFKRCIVFLQLEGGDVEQDDAIDRLFKRYKRLTPGRLYTVTATRVKIRQLPGNKRGDGTADERR